MLITSGWCEAASLGHPRCWEWVVWPATLIEKVEAHGVPEEQGPDGMIHKVRNSCRTSCCCNYRSIDLACAPSADCALTAAVAQTPCVHPPCTVLLSAFGIQRHERPECHGHGASRREELRFRVGEPTSRKGLS